MALQNCVAVVGEWNQDQPQYENARLIAAAPMLLDALEELVKDAVAAQWNMRNAEKTNPRWAGCSDALQPRIDAARAAIAAATGENNG